jgi:hypothetical protein
MVATQIQPISRWERTLRGMLGMGLIYSAVAFALMVPLAATVFFSGVDADDLDFLIVAPFGWAAIAFVLGTIYAGLLAFVARGRAFREISIWRVMAAGVVPGLIPAAIVLASDLIKGHPIGDALDPLIMFPPLSAAVAVVTLLIARKAKSAA